MLAMQLRAVPKRVRGRVALLGDDVLRVRPGGRAWSPVEVIGHLIDTMEHWRVRAELVAREDRPAFDPFDQNSCVIDAGYQHAALGTLLRRLDSACETFAAVVERLPEEQLARTGLHPEYGELSLRRCITVPLDSIDEHLDEIGRAVGVAMESDRRGVLEGA